jgi:GTPase SAR1 family protein
MDVTMIGLQNAGKTSLLRVLAVGLFSKPYFFMFADRIERVVNSL